MLPIPAALGQQVLVQLLPIADPRHRHQKAASGIAHQSFHLAFVIALARTSELLGKQVMALQLGEGPRLLPRTIPQNPRHRQLGVVVQDRARYPAQIGKGLNVAFHKGLCALGGKRHHEDSVRVGKVHGEEVRHAFLPGHHRQGLSEVNLSSAGGMGLRNKHFLAALPTQPHVVLHDGVATREVVLGPQAIEDPLSCVPLFGWLLLVFFQNGVDDAHPRP